MTPQIPPPHLLTRTLASPAWVCQMPVGSAVCACPGAAASKTAKIATMNPGLQAMNLSPEKPACITTNRIRAMLYLNGFDAVICPTA
jgi:hypothetical protein